MGITSGAVDVGQVYRTLRDLEEAGHVTSAWSTAPVGPQRREYELTAAGYAALDEWAAVMKERARLIGEFDARYLDVGRPRPPAARGPLHVRLQRLRHRVLDAAGQLVLLRAR